MAYKFLSARTAWYKLYCCLNLLSASMFSFCSSEIMFYLSLTSSTICIMLPLATATSWEYFSFSFSSLEICVKSSYFFFDISLFESLRPWIYVYNLASSPLLFSLSSVAFLMYLFIISLSLIRLRISVFSASVYFLKYSISRVRALTPAFVISFSFSADSFLRTS